MYHYEENERYEENEKKEYAVVYFDFDNIWATILDCTKTLLKNDLDDKVKYDLKNELENFLDETIDYLTDKYSVKYIKAFSDFNKLLFAEHINIVDILHKYGIKTYMPYVRNNKDMSDRALIISAIHDVMSKEPEVEEPKMILFTGDIDYLPLFDYISEYTQCSFEIFSFNNRLSKGYSEVFYTKNNITIIDDILEVDTIELEKEKKQKALEDYISNKNIDKNDKLDYSKITRDLKREYYCRFEYNKVKRFFENR